MDNQKIVETFTDLVKIDSPSGEEAAVAKYLQGRLGKLGIKFTSDSAGNLFARVDGSGQPVILCAHLDTVEPGRGIKPRVEDGLVTSDGTTILGADNKAAAAAIVCALESAPANHRPLEIIFSVREETDGGINHFDFTQLKSRTGLIADRAAEIGSVVLTSPWILNLDVTILGRPAHAGHPEDGINALTLAAKALTETSWGRIDPDTTANIGLISGGSAMNTIPGRVQLTGEIRSFSSDLLAKTLANIQLVFTQVSASGHAQLKFTPTPYCSGYVYRREDPGVVEITNILKHLGVTPFYETAFGASDANAFAAHRISVVTVGDGCRDPHTVGESVSVANLVRLTDLFAGYITYRP